MNNQNDPNKKPLTEEEAYKKALKRKTRYRIPMLNAGVLIVTVLLAAIIISCAVVIGTRNNDAPPDSEGTPHVTDALTETVTEELLQKGTVVKLGADEIHRGDLILVNSSHEYVFPDIPEDVSVFDNKSASYKVGDKNVTLSMDCITPFNRLMDDFYEAVGCRDVLVVSGFRTEEFQRQLYADRVESEGAEMAAKYVALPGQSEHHTGLAMDLSVYTDSGEGFTLRTYEKCKWLVDNFENYGFILRYPEDKASITGISYESWHYRYVGCPHSLIMKERDMCLEEYIELIRGLGEGRALIWDGSASSETDISEVNGEAAVYYVPAAPSGDTETVIPEGREYTVSGDNVGGFIVTLDPYIGVFTENEQH